MYICIYIPLKTYIDSDYIYMYVYIFHWKTYIDSDYVYKYIYIYMLYLSLAWPQLTYGILSWGRCGLGGIAKIIKAQNKIVKLIFGSSVQSTYISNSIFQFQKAYDYFAAIKLYREINNQSD